MHEKKGYLQDTAYGGVKPRWAPKPSISHTSNKAWELCELNWLIRYAPALLPQALLNATRDEAQLAPSFFMVGTIVDATITDALYRWRDGGPQPQNLFPEAKRLLRDMLAFSRDWVRAAKAGRPKPRGRFQPVDRVYRGSAWGEDEKRDMLGLIEACLHNFEQSEILDILADTPVDRWYLPPATPDWFFWEVVGERVPVYAKYDFAVWHDGTLWIYDWKTGDPEKDSLSSSQLHIYAAFAMTEWGVPRQQIRLVPCWLRTGQEEARRVSPRVLEETGRLLKQRWVEIRTRLHGATPENCLHLFPAKADPATCRRCLFTQCPDRADGVDNHGVNPAHPLRSVER